MQDIGDFKDFAAVQLPLAYVAVVLFLEPFYVASGFAMYLNRRAELEAWDIEQELRHAFPA
jgi:thiosulfate reductase cytochrome b subunit